MNLRRLTLSGALLVTPALGLLSATPAGATESSVDAEFACTSVTVRSDRHDLSNVVLRFADGDQKFEGLRGRTGTFAGTGGFAGDRIAAVFIKAGNNKSGGGPGYGERVDAPADSCTTPAPAPTPGGPKAEATKGGGHEAPKTTGDNGDKADGGGAKGGDAVVGAEVSCDGTSVTVTSTKDLSNVVLVLDDGTHVKHDGLSGHRATFPAPAGRTIVAVYIKSGANHSGDGPGYGQRVDAKPCAQPAVKPAAASTPTPAAPLPTPTPAPIVPAVVPAAASTPAPAPAALAQADVLAAATDASVAPAGEVAVAAVAADAGPGRDADVLGVSLERSAPAAAASGLARTGIDLSQMLLVAFALLSGGVVVTRRAAAAAKRS